MRLLFGSRVRCINTIAILTAFLLLGCASHAPLKSNADTGITTHISHGVKVYTSPKNLEVRTALLDGNLHMLTRNSVYLFIDNRSSESVAVSLQNMSLKRGKNDLRLVPLADVIVTQEKLSDEALGDAKLPKVVGELRKETTRGNVPRSEIKEATAAGLKAAPAQPSLDPLLDELANEKLLNPRDAASPEKVTEAHQMIIASLSKHYIQPMQLAAGQKMAGFIKFAQDLAPTDVPLVLKVTIGQETTEFIMEAPAR